MQVDSLLSSLNDIFNLDSTREPESADAAPPVKDSTSIDRSFDSKSDRDWCELVRDITALANSGGGQIRLGAVVDESQILCRLAEYSDSEFADISVRSLEH